MRRRRAPPTRRHPPSNRSSQPVFSVQRLTSSTRRLGWLNVASYRLSSNQSYPPPTPPPDSRRQTELCPPLSAAAPSELRIFNELCAMREDPGPCKAIKERYFFNVDTGSCELFDYGGCGGNDNNFETMEACVEICVFSGRSSPTRRSCLLRNTSLVVTAHSDRPRRGLGRTPWVARSGGLCLAPLLSLSCRSALLFNGRNMQRSASHNNTPTNKVWQ